MNYFCQTPLIHHLYRSFFLTIAFFLFLTIGMLFSCSSEFDEQFEVRLVGASGGAILGQHVVSVITIAKSDSPNGAMRFLNRSEITIPNPNVTVTISLMLERIGGHIGEAQVLDRNGDCPQMYTRIHTEKIYTVCILIKVKILFYTWPLGDLRILEY